MAGGALLQLVAYGAQDIYLTGNPQITFFKLIYRRHTNFSMEWCQQKQNNGAGKFGQKMEVVIERVGDLLGATHIEVEVPALMQEQPGLDANGNPATSTWVGFCNSFMHAAVDTVEFQIGGQVIDKQYGDWLEIWSELTINESLQYGYKLMVGKYPSEFALRTNAVPLPCKKSYRFRLPLQFWFNRNPGCYLPLIALQYHEVRMIIKFRTPAEIIRSDVRIREPLDYLGRVWNATDIQVWSNYIYLDTDERRKFAQVGHEMLIDQLQFNSVVGIPDGANYYNADLEFNHPMKEIVWVVPGVEECEAGNSLSGNNYFAYANQVDTFWTAKIILNGNDRFDAKHAEYFRTAQPFEHHTRTPQKFIYCYSFALRPEELQPSGTCNASRLDNITLNLTFNEECGCVANNRQFRIYATNYNILRIMSGMGGLAFSN